jgi:sulfur-carrier protein
MFHSMKDARLDTLYNTCCMNITVKLFASLRHGRFEERVVNCAPESTVELIVQDLGIPIDQVSIILVNDRHVNSDYPLSEEDVLSLFPPLGGG